MTRTLHRQLTREKRASETSPRHATLMYLANGGGVNYAPEGSPDGKLWDNEHGSGNTLVSVNPDQQQQRCDR